MGHKDFSVCEVCGEANYDGDIHHMMFSNIMPDELRVCKYCKEDLMEEGLIEYVKETDAGHLYKVLKPFSYIQLTKTFVDIIEPIKKKISLNSIEWN